MNEYRKGLSVTQTIDLIRGVWQKLQERDDKSQTTCLSEPANFVPVLQHLGIECEHVLRHLHATDAFTSKPLRTIDLSAVVFEGEAVSFDHGQGWSNIEASLKKEFHAAVSAQNPGVLVVTQWVGDCERTHTRMTDGPQSKAFEQILEIAQDHLARAQNQVAEPLIGQDDEMCAQSPDGLSIKKSATL